MKPPVAVPTKPPFSITPAACEEVELVRHDRIREVLVIDDTGILVVLRDAVISRSGFPRPVVVNLTLEAGDAADPGGVVEILARIGDQTIACGHRNIEGIAVKTGWDGGATSAGEGTWGQRSERA
jgi:hypothetical protein